VRKSNDSIEQCALNFLQQYNKDEKIPIPIENIIEIQLGIAIVPIKDLLKQEHIDAFISHDFKQLYIDEESYMNQTNRSRFTLAHEIGHFCMHQEIVADIVTLEEWRSRILGAGTGRAIYETEANIFAGYLLMPTKQLINAYKAAKKKMIEEFRSIGKKPPEDDKLIPYAANVIARHFDVSEQAAQNRLDSAYKSNILVDKIPVSV